MTEKKALFLVVISIAIITAFTGFSVFRSMRDESVPEVPIAKQLEDLRTDLQVIEASVRVLTDTLTKYEDELRTCRARPLCTDPVAPGIVPEHPASDEEPTGSLP